MPTLCGVPVRVCTKHINSFLQNELRIEHTEEMKNVEYLNYEIHVQYIYIRFLYRSKHAAS